MVPPGPRLDAAAAIVAEAAEGAGRDASDIGMECMVRWTPERGELLDHIARWRAAGATHVSINTMGAGFVGVGEHLEALAEAATTLGL